jgi:hypothetical protein
VHRVASLYNHIRDERSTKRKEPKFFKKFISENCLIKPDGVDILLLEVRRQNCFVQQKAGESRQGRQNLRQCKYYWVNRRLTVVRSELKAITSQLSENYTYWLLYVRTASTSKNSNFCIAFMCCIWTGELLFIIIIIIICFLLIIILYLEIIHRTDFL